MVDRIPVSVIVVTRNEAENLPRCLAALSDFDEIIIVDSGSEDGSAHIAAQYGASFISYIWNGHYPKKRQWCLDHLNLRNERIFFVDADEVVPQGMADEIRRLDWSCDGYFIKGQYIFKGAKLRFGLMNNKLALFNRRAFMFPVIDDLDIPGMGEIEGHYQPVPKRPDVRIGQIDAPLLHYAGDEGDRWTARHQRYAHWEAHMICRNAYPRETSFMRALLKKIFRHVPCRPEVAFLHSYVVKLGMLDGKRGFYFARSRWRYYRMVKDALSSASKETVQASV